MESRRSFIKKTTATIAGLEHRAPRDKMNIVGIDAGGKGNAHLAAMDTENMIGLCDSDWKYAQ